MSDNLRSSTPVLGGAIYGMVLGGLAVAAVGAGADLEFGPLDPVRLTAAIVLAGLAAVGLVLVINVGDTKQETRRAIGVGTASLLSLVAATRAATTADGTATFGAVALDSVASVVLGGILIVAAVDVVLRRRDDARDLALRHRRADLVMFNVARAGNAVADATARRSHIHLHGRGSLWGGTDRTRTEAGSTLADLLGHLRADFGEMPAMVEEHDYEQKHVDALERAVRSTLPAPAVAEARRHLAVARDILMADSHLVGVAPTLDDLEAALESVDTMVANIVLILPGLFIKRALEAPADAFDHSVSMADQQIDTIAGWPAQTELENRLRAALNGDDSTERGVPRHDWTT